MGGIANTSLYFNTSTPALTSTCIPTSDRIPPLYLQQATGKPHSRVANQGGSGVGHAKVLPATTALALGSFPAFSLRTPSAVTLNWFTPQGNQLASTNFGRFAPLRFNALNGQGSMPLLLYNASLRAVALTPLGNFFVVRPPCWAHVSPVGAPFIVYAHSRRPRMRLNDATQLAFRRPYTKPQRHHTTYWLLGLLRALKRSLLASSTRRR